MVDSNSITMCSFKVQFIVVAVVLCVSVIAADQEDYEGASTSKRSFERDCDAGYSVTCFKLDIVSFLEKMTDAREFTIMSGISIVQDPNLNQSKNSEIVAGRCFLCYLKVWAWTMWWNLHCYIVTNIPNCDLWKE